FNITLANLISDIKACFKSRVTSLSHSEHFRIQDYDYGTLSLIFKHPNTVHNITTDARTAIKSLFDAKNFNDILHLERWDQIKLFSDQSKID
ncbi:MAG TPA: hypothetical protein VM660_04225, partial [Bacillus sp. (in: firmicutes)]|nr:hypothetical protein [Bacillus sp. (in: firmicutes)]